MQYNHAVIFFNYFPPFKFSAPTKRDLRAEILYRTYRVRLSEASACQVNLGTPPAGAPGHGRTIAHQGRIR